MRRIGLALSGGGFRATLYHLGLVRFLRDAGVLGKVTHITSVSGGSILAAHLALRWDRYNGSANDFDAAAAELLAFVRLDVRNRIVRRFPLVAPLNWLRPILPLASTRRFTRAGLLEYHYQRYLYGDTSLSELPPSPQLHILATNLSEGSLCSFSRNGLLVQRRQAGGGFGFDHVHIGLATVPMAVAASSAFPAFFPPLELTAEDVGAPAGTFPGHVFTDGGVFDNLGVRLFRYQERHWLAEAPLSRHDFRDFEAAAAAIRAAGRGDDETPLHRLVQVLVAPAGRPGPRSLPNGAAAGDPPPPGADAGGAAGEERLLAGLSDLLLRYQFHRDPLFAALPLADHRAQDLLDDCRSGGRALGVGDQVWLNRHLLEAALRQATGRPCIRRLDRSLDGVLVSDVGKSFQVRHGGRASGLIRTAMRATDILMDRVWQLENEAFGETPGFIFAPVTSVVTPAEDPTALPAEVQRQAANIRTDLDRFSPLEISSLVRHGYCVGRQACRSRPDVFGADLPAAPPWDPVPAPPPAPTPVSLGGPPRAPSRATVEARALQASAVRRIWRTLLDYRDWVSYVYVPLVVPILVLLPYFVTRYYERSHRVNQLVEALAQDNPELHDLTHLLEHGPEQPWTGVAPEEVVRLDDIDNKSYEILQDSRVVDMRPWKPGGTGDARSWITVARRLRVRKLQDQAPTGPFRVHLLTTNPRVDVVFPPQPLEGKLRVSHAQAAGGPKQSVWETSYDFSKVPAGQFVDVSYKYVIVGHLHGATEEPSLVRFPIEIPTAELSMWMLLPKGMEHQQSTLIRYPTGKPGDVQAMKAATQYLAEDSRVIAFKLLGLKPGYTYELSWVYRR